MSTDVDPVLFVLDVHMTYTVIIYCVICFHVIAASRVRSARGVLPHVYTLVDDL